MSKETYKEVMKEMWECIPWWFKTMMAVIIAVFTAVAVFSVVSCSVMKDDSALEEYIEEKIKDQTGVDVDFSGESSECEKIRPLKMKLSSF